MDKNRFEKRKETMNQIRRLLLKEDRTWQQLLNEVKRSPATLGVFLEELMKNGEVSDYTDSKDRRITFYTMKNKEKASAEIERYETTEFIFSLKNLLYAEKPFEDVNGKHKIKGKIGIFMENPTEDVEDAVAQIKISNIEQIYKIANKFALTLILEKQ
jgi:hypothetical protein